MSIPNVWHHRKVAESAAKGCDICHKPTSSVLVTPDKADFFYACPGHLKDGKFCKPLVDQAAEEARKQKEKDAEVVAQARREYEEKQRRKKDKDKEKPDGKDEKDKEKDPKAEDDEKKKDEPAADTKVCSLLFPSSTHFFLSAPPFSTCPMSSATVTFVDPTPRTRKAPRPRRTSRTVTSPVSLSYRGRLALPFSGRPCGHCPPLADLFPQELLPDAP